LNSSRKDIVTNYSDKNLNTIKKFETMKAPSSNPNIQTMNYKTKPCRHFESGKCKLSGLCNFAHGQEELNFYQRMAKIDDKSLRTIETLSQLKVETSVQKIEKMEKLLENFYCQQRTMLEQLKNITLSIKSGSLKNEENISQMETNIINVYNSAVTYTQEIGKTMDILNHPSKINEPSPYEEYDYSSGEFQKQTPFVNIIDELGDDQLELVKQQIQFILFNLKNLPWKPTSPQYIRLYNAEMAYKNNQLLESSKNLQLIIFDKSLDQILSQACKRILDEATSWKF